MLFDRFDENLWERIEEALIHADVGVDTTVVHRRGAGDSGEPGHHQDVR